MKTRGTKPMLFAALAGISFCAAFILSPIGSFTVWITIGITVYFLFMTIWSLVPPPARPFTKKRSDPKAEEQKAYINFHLRMLLNLFLVAILFVIVFLWLVS